MKVLISALLLVGSCLAQRSDTIVQLVIQNLATASFTSTPVQNIGQYSHQLYVQEISAGGHTCVNTGFLAELLGSYDGQNYSNIPQQTINLNLATGAGVLESKTVQGFGAYNFIVAKLSNYDNTNCRLTAYYAGVINPISSLQGLDGAVNKIGFAVGAGTVDLTASLISGGVPSFDTFVLNQLDITCPDAGHTITINNGTSFIAYLFAATPTNFHFQLPYTGRPWAFSNGYAAGVTGITVVLVGTGSCTIVANVARH